MDITEERRAQERLRVLANTDTITGLPNRNAINHQITETLEKRTTQQMGVVYLDLDNFKKVNDAYGHMFGDQLLQAVSWRSSAVWIKLRHWRVWAAMNLLCLPKTPARLH